MLRLSLFKRGTLACALIVSSCLVETALAQRPRGGAPTRSTVVAGLAGEEVPITRKKYVGNVEAIEEVASVARVSGIITVAPGFENGAKVTKGQLLFTIDPVPYQAKVDAAKASIQQLEAQIDYAEKNFNRVNDLYSRNAGSKNDMESAESNLLSLRAQLLAANAQLVLAEEDLSYTQVKSELNGRAGRMAYTTGNYVSLQSNPLVKIVQTDPIYVRFTMSERDYLSLFKNFDDLKKQSEIQITLPNDETYNYQGEISFIDNSVKSTTDTIKVWATFSNPEEILSPGGVVTVNLAKHSTASTATVWPSAVMFDGQKNYVYILVDSIDDESLYEEIKKDSRFSKNIEAMEKGLAAVLEGNDAVSKFIEEYSGNLIVARFVEQINKALEKGDASAETIELCASLGNMKFEKPALALELLRTNGFDGWKAEYLNQFKTQRYVYANPQTKEVQNDFVDNKVNKKYRMILRRDVELGPPDDDFETILSGVKPNEVVVMDGVHKGRPFDLVVPIYRDKDKEEKAQEAQARNNVESDSKTRNERVENKNDLNGKQEAKRPVASKKLARRINIEGDVAA